MIEGISGIEVCRRLRRRPDTANLPIIMLTARGEEGDRIRGLETGADDYVTKPFSPRSWSRAPAPCCAASARRWPRERSAMPASKWTSPRTASAATARPVPLGPTEFRLLRHFLENPGRVFSRQQLLETVWPHSEDIELRTVDVHVRRLRLALNDGGRPTSSAPCARRGYSLDAEA